jgi:hypothetical protein
VNTVSPVEEVCGAQEAKKNNKRNAILLCIVIPVSNIGFSLAGHGIVT